MSQFAGWRQILIALAAGVATFVTVDCFFRLNIPVFQLREVEDGIADYRDRDPQVVVLGSSHARTFETVALELAARTGGAEQLVSVPVEFGKLDSYRWVLEHRLLPLMVKTGADGRPIKKNLTRFVLVTEWWDSCDSPPALNLPSRAWALPDFLADLVGRGLTDFNRNYLQTRWRRHLWFSFLAQDRGYYAIHGFLGSVARHNKGSNEDERVRYGAKVQMWQAMIERGSSCIGNPGQMAALASLLDTLRTHRLDITLLLFPRKPATITESGRQNTLARFSGMARAIAANYGARFVDFTLNSPLNDADFMADFDHVSAGGNRKFAVWALDGELKFLVSPAGAATNRAGAPTTR